MKFRNVVSKSISTVIFKVQMLSGIFVLRKDIYPPQQGQWSLQAGLEG